MVVRLIYDIDAFECVCVYYFKTGFTGILFCDWLSWRSISHHLHLHMEACQTSFWKILWDQTQSGDLALWQSAVFDLFDVVILRWDANDSDDCWRCANGKSYLVFDVSQTGSNNLGKRSFFLRVLYLWFTDSTGLVSCLCCLFDWKIVHLLEFCWGEALLVQATMWRSFNLLWLQMMYWMSIGVSP